MGNAEYMGERGKTMPQPRDWTRFALVGLLVVALAFQGVEASELSEDLPVAQREAEGPFSSVEAGGVFEGSVSLPKDAGADEGSVASAESEDSIESAGDEDSSAEDKDELGEGSDVGWGRRRRRRRRYNYRRRRRRRRYNYRRRRTTNWAAIRARRAAARRAHALR